MATQTLAPTKDNTSRQKWADGTAKRGRGANERLLMGRVQIAGTWYKVRSFIKFEPNWSGIEVVTAATLTLTIANNTGDSELAPGDSPKVSVCKVKKSWAEGSGTAWSADAYAWPPLNTNIVRVGEGSGTPGETITINVMPLLRQIAPERVKFVINGENVKGLNEANNGWALRAQPEGDEDAAVEVWSSEHDSGKPSLDIVHEQVNVAPSTSITELGSVTADFAITGDFTDTNANDYMSGVHIQIDKQSGDFSSPLVDQRRSVSIDPSDDLWHLEDGDFDKSRLKKDIGYKVRAKVFDKHNKASEWSNSRNFTITSDVPTVTADSFGSLPLLDGVLFGGAYTVDDLTEALTADIRVLSGADIVWSYSRPATEWERYAGELRFEYGGPTLGSGDYTYQVRLTDALGGQSEWSTAGDFTLTADSPDTEAELVNVTGYAPVAPTTRIVLKEMSSNRGPGPVKAIIEDFTNLGVSWAASDVGELHFTLPVTHPQVSACDPLVTHYSVEQFRRGRWKVLASGILIDFDAREDDVIIYGMDYLGLLSWSIEAAKQPSTNHKKKMPTKVSGTNGARYFKKKIKYIIRDQLNRARKQDAHSPVKFIETGDIGDFDTVVTIYCSFVQRLQFIRGLIESHKGAVTVGGGERRSRLRVRYNSARQRWQFDALDNVGSDRDNIRLEYGGLLQGYRIIAFDGYANIIYGAGHEPNKVKPHFQKATAPGISQSDWGSIGQANFWSDVSDAEDLTRRARAEAIRMSRVGKRFALGLRVNGLAIFDGYDILDNIPISIDDGVVDTSEYGSGYWTIWGAEYRVYPDGHDEVTLVVRPKGDSATIDTDLIGTSPIHASADWKWGSGAPTG